MLVASERSPSEQADIHRCFGLVTYYLIDGEHRFPDFRAQKKAARRPPFKFAPIGFLVLRISHEIYILEVVINQQRLGCKGMALPLNTDRVCPASQDIRKTVIAERVCDCKACIAA
jgi:hypothetical protein